MRKPGVRCGVIYSAIIALAFGFGNVAQAATNEVNIATRVAKLERTLESRGLVDLLQQVEALESEVQRLRGQIEEQAYAFEQLRKTQRDTYVDVDRRLVGLERGAGVVADRAPGQPGVPPLTTLNTGRPDSVAGTPAPQSSLQVEMQPEAPLTRAASGEPATLPSATAPAIITAAAPASIAPRGPTIDSEASETAYRDAFSLLKAGQYDESIAAFSGFLQQYPSSQYADNAQYWLGETFYVQREFEPAIAEYRKLIENYPASKKQSHAMLKMGYSYDELGQIDQARAVLEDLRSRYTGTTAARLADERIQRMADEQAIP
jgi:tol-pal system protein YbgF